MLSLGSCQTLKWKRYSAHLHFCTKKRGTLLLPVPLFEVFELTRFVETSNADPTLYVYYTLNPMLMIIKHKKAKG